MKTIIRALVLILALSVVSGCSKKSGPTAKYKIGFANLTEDATFFADVRTSIDRAAKKAGDIEVIMANNRMDGATALTNAETFINQDVDLAIEFQTDEKFGPAIMEKFNARKIPVIAIDIPHPGAVYFGANNYKAGLIGGEAAAKYATEHWGGQVDKVLSLELPQSGDIPAKRMKGQLDGIRKHIKIADRDILHLDSKNTLEEAQRVVANVLNTMPDAKRILVVTINDGTALGAIAALEIAGRKQQAAVFAQGADASARQEIRKSGSILIGSVAYFPERYGDHLIPLALDILEGRPHEKENFVNHVLITKDNVDKYYPGK
ncbi:MAG TPA: sugar ABC transporter substrate-binding protein [Armatimonadota bacterium]|nr:sugar ABC transporter substrate-binding protein [Armatimonadota bacterium]